MDLFIDIFECPTFAKFMGLFLVSTLTGVGIAYFFTKVWRYAFYFGAVPLIIAFVVLLPGRILRCRQYCDFGYPGQAANVEDKRNQVFSGELKVGETVWIPVK